MQIVILLLSFFTISTNCIRQTYSEKQQVIHEVERIRKEFHIPGLSFGVANCDSIIIAAALGIRQIDTTDSVTTNDYFHIASLGKGLFAFITGKLVDEGKITWDTGFFDLFPELKDSARKEYHDLQLSDLLSMRTTLIGLNDWNVEKIIAAYNMKYPENRFSYYKFAEYALTLEPVKLDPGQFFNYTSMGYVLANLMIQKASGLSYSQLLKQINQDLNVNFIIGWPKDMGVNQPSGHLIPTQSGWGESNKLEVLNGDSFTDWGEDFLYYNTPSGHHSVNVPDYLKFLQLNLQGLTGQDNYLNSETYNYIFNAEKTYSMGWGNEIVNGNHYYSHSGSAGNFEARAIIIKEAKIAITIMLNAGNNEAIGGMYKIIKYLENKYAPMQE